VSVFVNPAQFGPNEDFGRYPRDLTRDAATLTDYNVDYIFAPAVEEIYPKGFATSVIVPGLSDQMEGVSRPGHFRGVATVVAILLNVVRPDFAFFGQKDAQQTAVVKRMVRDMAFDTEVVVLPTVREETGLALSSRNEYLNPDERKAATVLFRSLKKAKEAYKTGERSGNKLAEIVKSVIDTEPKAKMDYVSVTDAETLEPVDRLEDRAVLIALAIKIGKARLIDNVILNRKREADNLPE